MITVRISEDALQDLNDGFLFYEAQQDGLGDYFVTCLRADIEDCACMPESTVWFTAITTGY